MTNGRGPSSSNTCERDGNKAGEGGVERGILNEGGGRGRERDFERRGRGRMGGRERAGEEGRGRMGGRERAGEEGGSV